MTPYSKALLDYSEGNKTAKLRVWCNQAATESWKVETFFRPYDQMPQLEKEALNACKGKILDIGAGAGSHALHLQQAGFEVTAIDIEQGASEVMKKRGIHNSLMADFYAFQPAQPFDTLLLLMNGIGIAQTIDNLPRFFDRLKELLAPDGQILLDSSDIAYLFVDEEGEMLIDLNAEYFGQLQYRMDYNREKGTPFQWLFIDIDTLSFYASQSGLKVDKLFEDDHFQYLARLTTTL